MKRYFNTIPLPVKLLLIGVIPLIFIIFISIQLNKRQEEKIENLKNFTQRIDRYSDLMQLIDELQLERRYSFNYAALKLNNTEMILQRKQTSAQIKKIQDSYKQLTTFATYTFLDSIDDIRSAIDRGIISSDLVSSYYTNALFRVNTLSVISTAGINYLEPINPRLLTQRSLSEASTYLGILRMGLYTPLLQGNITPEVIAQQSALYSIYVSFITEMKARAIDDTRKRVDSLLNDPLVQNTNARLHKVFVEKDLNMQLTADQWLNISAAVVDKFRNLQKTLLSEVRKGVSDISNEAQADRIKNIILLLVILTLVALVIFYTANSINRSLSAVRDAAIQIAKGKVAGELPVVGNDAIGSLVNSIQELDQANHQMSSAANAIGSGDFSVRIDPRSKEDLLGNSLLRMRDDLAAYAKENETKIWLQTGITEMATSLQGEKTPEQVSSDALGSLANYLGAHYAVCYTSENEHLVYTADHALIEKSFLPQTLQKGETLIGEAADKNTIIRLKGLPEHFLKVSTAAGEAQPNELIIFPLCHDDKVEGVIELGTLHHFDENIAVFVKEIGKNIAIAIRSAKSRKQLQELFEEVQAQSEELQAQHQELENINAELEAQAEKLQSSEEELKVQQEELLQANKELEARSALLEERNELIVERNLQIQKKAEELEVTTRYKSEFLANMSHELRTPLNSILLLSRLLAENNAKTLNEEQIEYAKVIQSSGHGLLSLIDEILDLSKIESGKMELEYIHTSADELCANMKALFSPVAKDKHIDLIVNMADDVHGTIETDKMRVEQILKNLISNAIKFTSKGSVTLSVDRFNNNKHLIAFKVTDTGIGIPAEKQAMVFEAFQQADGSTKRKFGGTGLGLSISKQLAGLLGGEILLESQVGKGSSFTLLLPEAKQYAVHTTIIVRKDTDQEEGIIPDTAPISPAASEHQQQAPKLIAATIPEPIPDDRNDINENDKVILIVEDDTNFAKALMNYTRDKGYKVIAAVTGDTGIELAKRYRPAGVLLDIQLPVKDGWQVMEALKKDPSTRHIPVHIMSSFEAKKESISKGAIDFINKPVAFEQMNEILKKLEFVLNKSSKKVLIVEDNPKHAKALALFLETNNVKADVATTVDNSINSLKQKEIECVILDMGLPDMKAYETLEQVKKEKGLQDVPVIIFTGKTLSRVEEQKIKQYADSIVVKTAQSFRRILDEVSIFLHLMEENRSPSTTASPNTMNNILHGKKVLIADDDVRNIFSLTKALEAHKMLVVSAPDGKEAVDLLAKDPDIDVILMDMMMPEMDGYEATTLIRKQRKYQDLPIIAVTAKAMTGDREKCIKAGASDYISKPVDIDQLIALLKVWLYDRI